MADLDRKKESPAEQADRIDRWVENYAKELTAEYGSESPTARLLIVEVCRSLQRLEQTDAALDLFYRDPTAYRSDRPNVPHPQNDTPARFLTRLRRLMDSRHAQSVHHERLLTRLQATKKGKVRI